MKSLVGTTNCMVIVYGTPMYASKQMVVCWMASPHVIKVTITKVYC